VIALAPRVAGRDSRLQMIGSPGEHEVAHARIRNDAAMPGRIMGLP
jgi:hypothetical protein